MTTEKRAVLLLSGGIDSTVTLAELMARRVFCHAIIVDYGQTLRKEVAVAMANAAGMLDGHPQLRQWRGRVRVVHITLPLAGFLGALGSPPLPLLGSGPLPTGRTVETIATAGTPPTYVPFRNGIFLALAVAYGETHGIRDIYAGANGLHSGSYWDDTEPFAHAFQVAARVGTAPAYRPVIHFPNARRTKAQVVARALQLRVPLAKTWSCYTSGPQHCGQCDSCVQRQAAMAANGLTLEGAPIP